MSDTLHLACTTCKKELWIGQFRHSEPEKAIIYAGPEDSPKLAHFLLAHLGHPLVAVNLEGLNDDWEEAEPRED